MGHSRGAETRGAESASHPKFMSIAHAVFVVPPKSSPHRSAKQATTNGIIIESSPPHYV